MQYLASPIARRFPGNDGEWARFDGPAGTQMLDSAIDALDEFAASGDNANSHGAFSASRACDELIETSRELVAKFYRATADGVWFGANMTTMTFAFTRAVARALKPGDRIVGTRLDHDANVWPWHEAACEKLVEFVLAPFDAKTGRLDTEAMIDMIDERTRWVTIPGASNLIGTIPDVRAVSDAAHAVGANVFVDAVAFAPHRQVDVMALGADAIVSSAYKWYGPHISAMWVRPDLIESLRPFKVRPSENKGPARFETGTPNYEALAGLNATVEFLIEFGMDAIRAVEEDTFEPLLTGLQSIPGVRCVGAQDMVDRTPTVSFTIDGFHPDQVAAMLAAERVAVWSGDSYAVEAGQTLGVDMTGGVVRAGVVAYVTDEDVQRLLTAVERIASS